MDLSAKDLAREWINIENLTRTMLQHILGAFDWHKIPTLGINIYQCYLHVAIWGTRGTSVCSNSWNKRLPLEFLCEILILKVLGAVTSLRTDL